MTTFDRYLLTEIVKLFTAIILTLLAIMISMLLLQTLEKVNLGVLNHQVVVRYLGYQLLRDSVHLLPPAFFIAVLVVLGRMARDSELIAVQACGIGPLGLYRGILYAAIPLAALALWLALVLQPEAAAQMQSIRDLQGEQAAQIAGLRAGRYYQHDGGKITLYVAAIDRNKHFRDIFIQDRRAPRSRLVLAASGYYTEDEATGSRTIVLNHGRRYDGNPGAADYRIGSFENYRLSLGVLETTRSARRRPASTPTTALLGSDALTDRAELQHRFGHALAFFVLAVIAVPLTALSPRHPAGGRMLLAFLAYFAFLNLQGLAEHWFASGITPAWLGCLWYQPLIVVMIFAVLVPNSFAAQRLWRRLWHR